MRVISYSLFAPNGKAIADKYLSGLKANWVAKQQHFPEWEMMVYHDRNLPETHLEFMRESGIRHELRHPTRGAGEGYFWRFLPISDPECSIVLIRDMDSVLNVREKAAVQEWIGSDATFHVMRDHRNHRQPIMAGMWGCKRNPQIDVRQLMDSWHEFNRYGCDQRFLKHFVWPTIKESVMTHDSHPDWARVHAPEGLRPFPEHAEFDGFVGQVAFA